MRTLDAFLPHLKNRTALIRVDLNLPNDCSDHPRLHAALPTLRTLTANGTRCVLLSHQGRPKGNDPNLSLRGTAEALARVLGKPVHFLPDLDSQAHIAALPMDAVAMMENTRFHTGETTNDPELAARFAANGDVFVHDAFAVAHRAHASGCAIAHVMPSCMGPALAHELASLRELLHKPTKPFVAVVGGAKIDGKTDLLHTLLDHVDALMLGGGIANTFLAAKGYAMARSLVDTSMIATAQSMLASQVMLPVDVVAATSPDGAGQTVPVDAIPSDAMALDIGPETCRAYIKTLSSARTLVWNGPLGFTEKPAFAHGTNALAQAITPPLRAVAGGGETLSALGDCRDALTFASTGGGAFLHWLAQKPLPALAALAASRSLAS